MFHVLPVCQLNLSRHSQFREDNSIELQNQCYGFKCLSFSVTFTLSDVYARQCTVCTLLLWKLLIIIKQTFRIVGHKSWGQDRWLYRFTHFCQRHHYMLSFTRTHISIRTLTQIITKLISKQIFRTLWTCPKGTGDLLTFCLSVRLGFSHIYIFCTRAHMLWNLS